MRKVYHAVIETYDTNIGEDAGVEWFAFGLDRAELARQMRAVMTRLAPLKRWDFNEQDDDQARVTIGHLKYETYIAEYDLVC